VVVAVVALAVAGGAQTAGAGYRTATVATRSVDQTLPVVGTVVPVAQASVAFPTSGEVASVDVRAGDEVTGGQPLAALRTDDLEGALVQQQAALAQAQLALAKAVASHDAATTPTTAAPAPAGGATAGDGSPQLAATGQEADAAVAAADRALATATAACTSPPATTTTTSSTTTSTSVTTVTTATTSTTVPATPPADGSGCLDALRGAATAEQAAGHAQHAYADALAAAATQSSPDGTGQGGDQGSGGRDSSGGTGTAGPAGPGGATSTSAAGVAAAQASVDAAAAHVAVAEQALAQATIVSPIPGRVVSVGMAVGDDVTAASATQAIVVVGDGGHEVATTVGVDRLPHVTVGAAATVVPDGTATSLPGTVVAIGLSADSSGRYPVTIGLRDPTAGLRDGSLASVSIVLKAAATALAVPTSAVHATAAGGHTVTVLDGSAARPVAVEVGAVGATWTEVTTGLHEGQRVVLADLGEPLPSSASATAAGGQGAGRTFQVPAGGLRFRGGG
jgi:HlyD family secretion protein